MWTRHEHQCKYGILRKLMEQEGSQHTQLCTTGIFQLNLERTHLKCFHIMETVRKIFISGIPQQRGVMRKPFGIVKEPLQAKLTLLTTWSLQPGVHHSSFGTWEKHFQEKHKPVHSSRRVSPERASGPAGSWLCKKEASGWWVQQEAADRNPRKTSSWKWQEGTSSWEGGGKRKGKAYKEMEVFTGSAEQLQRRIFFSVHLFTTMQS